MAVNSPPFFLQNGSHSAKTFRQMVSALTGMPVQTFSGGYVQNFPGGGHGVVGLNDLKVTQRGLGVNRSVDVAAGFAFITGTSSLAQGTYAFTNDAAVNLPLTTADVAFGRHDAIVAQVRDTAEDAGGASDARLLVVTGNPSASPALPAIPPNCLLLATVFVAANVTSVSDGNITDRRTWAAALGGVRYVSTPGGMPSSARPGDQAFAASTQRTYTNLGPNNWRVTGGPTPRFRVYRNPSSGVTVAANTPTALSFNQEEYDTDGLHSNAANPSRITFNADVAGVWAFGYDLYVSAASGIISTIQVYLTINGSGFTTQSGRQKFRFSSDAHDVWLNGSLIAPVNTGDYLELIVEHNPVSGTASRSIGEASNLHGAYIGPS